MISTMQHRISRIGRRAARAALALAVVLAPAIVATPSASAQSFSVIYSFTGGSDGANPSAGLIQDAAGNFYGTTYYGPGYGNGDTGVVFKLDTNGKETALHAFTGIPDGANPTAGLVGDAAGNLYGTTLFGGVAAPACFYRDWGCGVVFKLDPTGKETVLHRFTGGADGALPHAGLVRDQAGNLYGTTTLGGDSNSGVVFKLDPTGKLTVLHSFTGVADGLNPFAGLIRDAAGNLYGTTQWGGDVTTCNSLGCGTVFMLDPTGNETVLYRFRGGGDGESPFAGLVRDRAGNFYGTTVGGGASNHGTVFQLDNTGKETVLYSFAGPIKRDGALPEAGVVRDATGNLYGTTFRGGGGTYGTVFKVDTSGKETVLHQFTGGADGAYPSGLIRDRAGNLYGTTYGSSNNGTVFKITP
jgi:uncharacterized repeat protein (TIGR03803 family)